MISLSQGGPELAISIPMNSHSRQSMMPFRVISVLFLSAFFYISVIFVPGIDHHAVKAGGLETSFFSDIADLPVMPGLIEDEAAGMAFDRPDGRIVQAVASGHVSPDAVLAFYQASLPSLGWQAVPTEKQIFQRGEERLQLSIEAVAAGGVILTVSLQPISP